MPHKHKRDKSKNDASSYDLPPINNAQSLPVKKAPPTTTDPSKRKHARPDDDTPRAFTRLLTAYRPPRSGLDDGTRPSKKQNPTKTTMDHETIVPLTSLPTIRIQPHEPLSSFAARVDAALPFSGLSKKSGGGKNAERERKTKTERKMQRMQREWREEDRRRKEKAEEEEDHEAINEDGAVDPTKVARKGKKKGGKRKRGGGGVGAEVEDDEDDPWAHIRANRTDDSGAGLVGLHDVVLAPPKFTKVPKGKENVNIGQGAGGLKRQAELTEARRSVVEGYRQMMRDKRREEG